MESKIILEIQLQNSKLREQLEAITNDIKKQQAEMKELVKQNKLYAETTEYKKKAAAVDGMKNTQKNLTAAIKEQNAEEKRLKQTQAALDKQRQSSLAAMAKEEAKQRELIRAATMEAKSEEDLIKKKNALIAIRKRVDQSTEEGRKAYERMGKQINGLNDQLKNSDKAIGNHQRNVGNYPKVLSGAIVGITAAIAVIGKLTQSVKQSIETFLRQEDANDMVNDVFGEYSSVINQAANDTQKFTKIGNEQYQELAVQAKNFGIANKDVNQTVKDAIGLADLYGAAGADEAGMLEALIDAQNGKTKGLEKYVKELRGVTDEEERNRILQEKIAQGWLMASTAGATYGDQLAMIKNAAGDLQEEVGKQVLEGVLGSPAEIGKVKKEIENMIEAMERTGVISKTLQNIKGIYMSIIEPIADLAKRLGIASDNTELFEVVLKGVGKVFEALLTPIKLIYNNVGTMITFWVELYDILSNIKEASFEDIFTLIKQTAFDLISPLTDLIGVSDEVAAMFGVQTDAIKMTRDELDKLHKMLFHTMDAFKEYKAEVEKAAEEQAEITAGLEELTAAEEAEKKAKEDLIKKNEDFVKSLKAINDEYEYQMYFAKTTAQEEKALQEKMQKTFDAYKQFFADGGYTGDELRKLQELQDEIYNFTDEIKTLVNNPELKLNIVPNKEDIEKATTDAMMVWQKASNEQEKARQQDIDEEKKAYEQKLKEAANFSGTLTEILASSLTDQGLDLKEYAKKTSLFLLDVLEKQVIAQVTATALAQPDSVATFGLTGAARAGIMIGLVKGGFSLAKALISNVAFAEKGALLSGDRHSSGGIMVNAEDGEAIINRNSVAQYKPILSAINQAGGGVPFMEQGGIAGFGNTATATSNTNIFDGVEIVATIEDINAGLVRESKRMKIARI